MAENFSKLREKMSPESRERVEERVESTLSKMGVGFVRAINPFFHVDTEGYVVKTSNNERIPDDEPVFLFRGRDRLAVPVLLYYRDLAIQDGCNDYMLNRVNTDLVAFEEFKERFPERMKQPGVTRGK